MLIDGLKSIRRERAALERDRVVLGALVESGTDYDPYYAVANEDGFLEESSDDDAEINKLIDELPESDERNSQIDKVLGSDIGLTVDDMMDIHDDDEHKVTLGKDEDEEEDD